MAETFGALVCFWLLIQLTFCWTMCFRNWPVCHIGSCDRRYLVLWSVNKIQVIENILWNQWFWCMLSSLHLCVLVLFDCWSVNWYWVSLYMTDTDLTTKLKHQTFSRDYGPNVMKRIHNIVTAFHSHLSFAVLSPYNLLHHLDRHFLLYMRHL